MLLIPFVLILLIHFEETARCSFIYHRYTRGLEKEGKYLTVDHFDRRGKVPAEDFSDLSILKDWIQGKTKSRETWPVEAFDFNPDFSDLEKFWNSNWEFYQFMEEHFREFGSSYREISALYLKQSDVYLPLIAEIKRKSTQPFTYQRLLVRNWADSSEWAGSTELKDRVKTHISPAAGVLFSRAIAQMLLDQPWNDSVDALAILERKFSVFDHNELASLLLYFCAVYSTSEKCDGDGLLYLINTIGIALFEGRGIGSTQSCLGLVPNVGMRKMDRR